MTAKAKTKPASEPKVTPDDLPEGWAQVTLPIVCEINPPKPDAAALRGTASVTFVPMPAVDAELGAITRAESRPFAKVRKGYTAFQDEDVIMAKITPCMENGKAAVARSLENGLGFGSTEFHVLRSNGAVMPDFLYHFIRQESYRKASEGEMTGSVGQKRVPADFLKGTSIPLPPMAEQERIILKVKETLTQNRSVQARLAKVPKILKAFRQSVLAAACSGRLTEDWREEHPDSQSVQPLLENLSAGVLRNRGREEFETLVAAEELPELPESWVWVPLKSLTRYIGDVDHKMPKAVESGIPYISTKDFHAHDAIDFLAAKQISQESYQALCRKIQPGWGDLLLSRYGTIGEIRLVEFDRPFQASYSVAILKTFPRPSLNKYLLITLRSRSLQQQMQAAIRASSQPDLGLKHIRGLLIPAL